MPQMSAEQSKGRSYLVHLAMMSVAGVSGSVVEVVGVAASA